MLLLRFLKQRSKSGNSPYWLEPRLAQTRGEAKEPTCDHPIQEVESGVYSIQAGEVPCESVEAFRITELGGDDAFDRSDACGRVAFEHCSGSPGKVARSRFDLCFQRP